MHEKQVEAEKRKEGEKELRRSLGKNARRTKVEEW